MANSVYDYCSPVFSGHGDEEPLCDPLYRAGSIYYPRHRSDTMCGDSCNGGCGVVNNTQRAAAQSLVPQPMPNKSDRIPASAPPKTLTPPHPNNSSGNSDNDNGGSNAPRFRTPVTPTPTLTQSPFDALPPPLLVETPQKPVNHGVTLELLRALDPSITDVEIVEIRE